MKLYGVDIGYGFTKVAGVDRIPRVIPSIVGSNEEISYRSDLGDRIKVTPLVLNGHSYLFGEAAKRFSRHRYRVFDSTWTEQSLLSPPICFRPDGDASRENSG